MEPSLLERHSLSDVDVLKILIVAKHYKRKRKPNVHITEEYSRKLKRIAVSYITEWKKEGMPKEMFEELTELSPGVISAQNIFPMPSVPTSLEDNFMRGN